MQGHVSDPSPTYTSQEGDSSTPSAMMATVTFPKCYHTSYIYLLPLIFNLMFISEFHNTFIGFIKEGVLEGIRFLLFLFIVEVTNNKSQKSTKQDKDTLKLINENTKLANSKDDNGNYPCSGH